MRKKSKKKVSDAELLEIIMSSTDQDNFEETMPTYLLEEWIREEGGNPEALWEKVEPFIQGLLAERAKRMGR
jgi:hypothetical protein